ncbi:MAG: hypothetical protein ACLSDO_02435 [Anaerotruncus colihominis]
MDSIGIDAQIARQRAHGWKLLARCERAKRHKLRHAVNKLLIDRLAALQVDGQHAAVLPSIDCMQCTISISTV